MIEKPIIDRDKVRRMEERQQRCLSAAAEAVRLLRPGEELGRPTRSKDKISFPIYHDRGGADAPSRRRERKRSKDQPSAHTAAFENGVI